MFPSDWQKHVCFLPFPQKYLIHSELRKFRRRRDILPTETKSLALTHSGVKFVQSIERKNMCDILLDSKENMKPQPHAIQITAAYKKNTLGKSIRIKNDISPLTCNLFKIC